MRIRRLVEQVDAQHRAAMAAIDAHRRDSRRHFVRDVGLGGAAALGTAAAASTLLAPMASAQTGADAETGAPRPELSEGDLAIAAFAEGLEWGLVELYGVALDNPVLDSQVAQLARTFQGHHRDHAGRFVLLRDGDVLEEGQPDAALVAEYEPRIADAATLVDAVQALYELEEGAAATYTEALGQLDSVATAQPVATILPIEGQHAVALGEILQLPVEEWMPALQTTDDSFEPLEDAG
jgi:hypothetical protein